MADYDLDAVDDGRPPDEGKQGVPHAETASTAVRAFLTADFGVYQQLHRELGQEDV